MRTAMGSFAAAIALALSGHELPEYSTPHHKRRGVKSNRYPAGGKPAMFASRDHAERAIRRAKRWLRNQSTGPHDVPPRHIFKNAELAAFQFGDNIKNA